MADRSGNHAIVMSTTTDPTIYHFLPWTRQGFASGIRQKFEDIVLTPENKSLRTPLPTLGVDIDGSYQGEPLGKLTVTPPAVHLFGPGDILGFDPRMVARTIPPADTGVFSATFFPGIEFTDPGFAWQFSPVTHEDPQEDGGGGNLIPWITLVVLVAESWNDKVAREFDDLTEAGAEGLPRKIRVHDVASLPNLDYAKFWAHVQITGPAEIDYVKTLQEEPELAICRLLCPRRLCPRTKYAAFVVPTFEAGRLAALGKVDTPTRVLAWDKHEATQDPSLELPYYYRWEFITGSKPQFEDLVRMLQRQKLSGMGIRPIDCSRPGFRDLVGWVTRDGVEEPEQHYLDLEGPLASIDAPFTPWGCDADVTMEVESDGIRDLRFHWMPFAGKLEVSFRTKEECRMGFYFLDRKEDGKEQEVKMEESVGTQSSDHKFTISSVTPAKDYPFQIRAVVGVVTPARGIFRLPPADPFQEKLAGLLNLPDLEQQDPNGTKSIVVVPPIYGRWHYGKTKIREGKRVVVSEKRQSSWIDMLNLDPRQRVAAGLGALVVRKNQEALMASAWEQLGDLKNINNLIQNAQNGIEASLRLHNRVRDLSEDDYLFFTRPLHKKIATAEEGANLSVSTYLQKKGIPKGIMDAAFRRISRPGGALRKRQKLNIRQVHALRQGGLTSQPVKGGATAGTGPGTTGNFEPGGTPLNLNRGLLGKYAANDPSIKLKPPRLAGSSYLAEEAGKLQEAFQTEGTVSQEEKVKNLSRQLRGNLDPRRTIVDRLNRRITSSAVLSARYLSIGNDPKTNNLRSILFAPEFPQPMIKELEKISHGLILPGIEKLPQNTIGLLKTNPRFIEAFLCGCNHEFAGELLWREYPTDQRGSYFRQFWDIGKQDPRPIQDRLYAEWLNNRKDSCHATDCISDKEKMEKLGQYYEDVQMKNYFDESGQIRVSQIGKVNRLFEWIMKRELWEEFIKDIQPMTDWGEQALGRNVKITEEQLVLVIRGELLRHYPNTYIYAVDAAGSSIGKLYPKHPAYDKNITTCEPQTPSFSFSLQPDITFLIFPFPDEAARQSGNNPGKYFILEEPVGESGFGLDIPSAEEFSWDNLSWEDFEAVSFDNEHENIIEEVYGVYADTLPESVKWDNNKWNKGSSAFRAAKTLQKPYRIAIHADQLLPDKV